MPSDLRVFLGLAGFSVAVLRIGIPNTYEASLEYDTIVNFCSNATRGPVQGSGS